MRQFVATLLSRFDWKKLDKLLYLESVAITPGIYTGIDGQTVHYRDGVLAEGQDSLLGKPILYAHTGKEGDEKFLTVGFVSKVKDENGSVVYGGYIYNPTIFPFIENGDLYASSAEINVQGDYDDASGYFDAEKVSFSGVTLTNTPADKEALHRSHEYVTQVRLEEKRKMAIEEEELEDYPTPKEKTFANLPDAEKLTVCRTFFKEKGMALPTKEEELDLALLAEAKKKYVCPVCKKGFDDWNAFFGHWGEAHKDEYGPFKKKGEAENPVPTELENEIKGLKDRVTYFEGEEVKRLEGQIKVLDKAFDSKKFLKGIDGFDAQKRMLEQFLDYAAQHKPAIKLELGTSPDVRKAKLAELTKTMFQPDLAALLKEEPT